MKLRSLLRSAALAAALSVLMADPSAAAAHDKSDIRIVWDAEGSPVPVPSALDPKYTAEGLTAAFHELARKLDFRVLRLTVDQSEFPFLVFAVVEGRRSYQEVRDTLPSLRGYAYGGCVSGLAGRESFFALSMVPRENYPREHQAAINQRLMPRLKALAGREAKAGR